MLPIRFRLCGLQAETWIRWMVVRNEVPRRDRFIRPPGMVRRWVHSRKMRLAAKMLAKKIISYPLFDNGYHSF